jgi:hypothetical protein
MKDISNINKTLAKLVCEELVPKLYTMNVEEIKEQFLSFVHSNDIYISQETIKRYEVEINKIFNKTRIQNYICNIALKASGMGVI